MDSKIRRTVGRPALFLPVTIACLSFAATAGATGAMEVPDNGSEQMARGGAWVARASDPEAALYNPAGLAGQPTALTVQGNLVFDHTCFTRTKAANDTTQDGVAAGASYGRACNDISPTVTPSFAFNYRVNPRLGLAIGVFTPSAASSSNFPDFVNGRTPSPGRYLLSSFDGTILSPTVAAGYELLPGWRVGASFEWTIAHLKLANASQELNMGGAGSSPASNDARAEIDVKDLFIPGFTLGTIVSPTPKIDIAGWYKWSAPIDASGNLTATSGFYGPVGGKTQNTDLSKADCGGTTPNPYCGGDNGAHFKVQIPQEAKIGLRFHQPRHDIETDPHLRDPMSQDIYDMELDLTYANDSAIDQFQIRLPGNNGTGTVLLNGTPGYIPPNADVPSHVPRRRRRASGRRLERHPRQARHPRRRVHRERGHARRVPEHRLPGRPAHRLGGRRGVPHPFQGHRRRHSSGQARLQDARGDGGFHAHPDVLVVDRERPGEGARRHPVSRFDAEQSGRGHLQERPAELPHHLVGEQRHPHERRQPHQPRG